MIPLIPARKISVLSLLVFASLSPMSSRALAGNSLLCTHVESLQLQLNFLNANRNHTPGSAEQQHKSSCASLEATEKGNRARPSAEFKACERQIRSVLIACRAAFKERF